jgi:peptide/nickel transport system substrate-binding protein
MGGRVPMSSEVVQAIAAYFEAVGIRTKIEGQEIETFYTSRRAGKNPTSDFVAYTSAGIVGSPDPTFGLTAKLSCEGGSSVYCNPELEKILSEAKMTVNDAKRGDLVKRMIKILQEEVAIIPIFDTVAIYGMRKNIDFVPTLDRLDVVLVKDIVVK